MIKIFFAFLFVLVGLCFSRPMEPLTNYNVIMVHGAADGVTNGFECNGTDANNKPYSLDSNHRKNPDKKPWQIGNAPGMIGYYGNSKKLTHWLDTKIFEDAVSNGSDYIYIQRSFTKPAGSPKDNGREIV